MIKFIIPNRIIFKIFKSHSDFNTWLCENGIRTWCPYFGGYSTVFAVDNEDGLALKILFDEHPIQMIHFLSRLPKK